MARVLGLDVGLKKIGVAIGDSGSGFAFLRPALLVNDWSAAWPVLANMVRHEHIDEILVGWPIHSSGRHSTQADVVAKFITELQPHVTVPITKRDERNTTKAVQREQQQAGRKLVRGQEDSLAAQLLVESYLQEYRS